MIGELRVTPLGVPEQLFGVSDIRMSGREVTGSARSAEWMRLDDGRPAAGQFGVPIDALVGQATLIARPEGTWPVTTELSVDVVAPPAPGSTVAVHGRLVAADTAVALARGEVLAADGTTLATATTRVRFTPGMPALDPVDGSAAVSAAAGRPSLRGALGATLTEVDGGVALSVPPGPATLNAAGNMHGGVILALADVAASAATAGPEPLVTAGLRVAYLRPGSADGPLVLTAEVLHRGRATALVRVDARGADGRLCASAVITALAPGGTV